MRFLVSLFAMQHCLLRCYINFFKMKIWDEQNKITFFLLQNVFENGHNWSKYSTTRKAWRGWIQRSTDHFGQRVLWYLNSFTQLHWKYQDRCQRTQARHTGGFHLHLLEFPFVYQFNSRIGVLVHSRHFSIISKFVCCVFLHKKECSFYPHLFCCTEMIRLFINLTAIWVTGSGTGSVASRAITKVTSSKCDWTRIWTT